MREYERIKVTRRADVETIALSYPERRNAIGPRMANELLWALDDARGADEVRSIVLTGEGSAFCSGGDFAEMASGVAESKLPRRGDYADLLLALTRSDKPVVARVNGHALGGGLGLVAASTFAVASTDATLGTPEIDVGLFPMIIMAVLARHVPRRRLVEMSLLGQRFGAEEALQLGLVNRAVAPDRLDAEVTAITDEIATKSPIVVRLGLRAAAAQESLDLERSLPLLRERLIEVLATDDCREGLAAFREKRAPLWTGK
ncbi:MAG: enoyl-CoA hydratase/isomerase family protein [Polyangiaceae bacterium]|jgi:enoyl-CoA hydratase/carnithine racemase